MIGLEERKILIELWKDGRWQDKTASVEFYRLEENCVRIRYCNNPTLYPTSYRNVRIDTSPAPAAFETVCLNGFPLSNVAEVVRFGDKIKVFYQNGERRLYEASQIDFETDILKSNAAAGQNMAYFQRLVQEIRQRNPEDPVIAPFEGIGQVSDRSIYANYLCGTLPREGAPEDQPLIFPFGVNLSQKAAVKKALEHRISVVQGPPGTGKTQTILNLIANLVLRGKSVAVVSTNNSAVENVGEKLKKYGFGDLAANLGKFDKRQSFFESAEAAVPCAHTSLSPVEKTECKRQISYYSEQLEQLFEADNELSEKIRYLAELGREYEDFKAQKQLSEDLESESLFLKKSSSQKIMEFLVLYQEGRLGRPSIWQKLKWRLGYGFRGGALLAQGREDLLELLYDCYYRRRLAETELRIEELRQRLKADDFKGAVEKYGDASKKILGDHLSSRKLSRTKLCADTFRQHYRDFLARYPVVLSTTFALRSCCPKGFLFDYVIADESSQINLLTAGLCMSCARNFVVSGDTLQLSQINPPEITPELNRQLMKQYGVDGRYSLLEHSLLSSLSKLYPKIPQTLLREHYRCHPRIIDFCNREFYGNQLIIKTEPQANGTPLNLLQTVPGNHARRENSSVVNIREAEEIRRYLEENPQLKDVGLITPYKEQVKKLAERIGREDVEASTIHRFQGREKRHIMFSATANAVNPFVDNRELINVAVSRAMDSFHLFVSEGIAGESVGTIADLIRYMRYYGEDASFVQGSVRSVFDLLYSDYAEALRSLKVRVSAFDSENLVFNLLRDTLDEYHASSLKVLMHVTLNQLIRDYQGFSPEEIRYLKHPWTHVDFVVINVMDKSPQLLLEVDGVRYHDQNPDQSRRDGIKDRAVLQNHLKLLRLKTNGSGEREQIVRALQLERYAGAERREAEKQAGDVMEAANV